MLQLIPQPVRSRPMTVNPLNTIRSAIDGYAGGPAIARELVQNADDATPEDQNGWIEFYFTPDRLIVRNSTTFSEQDFDAICEIAAGSKREKSEQVGTWGTGFLSVYQLTDHPELKSAGRHYIFQPEKQLVDVMDSPISNYSEFHFWWRKVKTETSRQLGTDVWSENRITMFKTALLTETYRVMPFLRRINRISVFEGWEEPVKLYEVTRRCKTREDLGQYITFERWELSWLNEQNAVVRDDWLLYSSKAGQVFTDDDDKVIKKPNIALGFCLKQSGLGGILPGTLYNFLPTDIKTGFNFHLNGDFFPDNSRRSIVVDGGGKKSEWNNKTLAKLGGLLTAVVLHLRDQCDTPTAFYRLLPLKEPSQEYFKPIVERFRAKTRELPLIYTTDKEWTAVKDVRWTDNNELRKLTQDYLAGVTPQSLPAEVTAFLKEMDAPRLSPLDLFDFIRRHVTSGTKLLEAHEIVNNRDKLFQVFKYLKDSERRSREENQSAWVSLLDNAPLALDQSGRLWQFDRDKVWQADDKTRDLLPHQARRLLDDELQEKFGDLLKTKVPYFRRADVLDYLREIAPECAGKLLPAAHIAVNNRDKLKRFFDYFAENSASGDLTGLPLCLDEHHTLHLTGPDAPWLADAETRQLLSESGFSFVAPEFASNAKVAAVLASGGVPVLNISSLLKWVEKQGQGWPMLRTEEGLGRLYDYLQSHRHKLTEDDVKHLRRLPLFRTQGGKLAAIETDQLRLAPLYNQISDDDLGLDILISEATLTPSRREFFSNGLKVETLTERDYLETHLLNYYQTASFKPDKGLKLLSRLFDYWHKQSARQQTEFVERIRAARLIYCNDGQYRQPAEVYFPNDGWMQLLDTGYHYLHQHYPVAEWHNFLVQLGVKEWPTAADLVDSVRHIITTTPRPTKEAVERVRQIYMLLGQTSQNWDFYKQEEATLSHLREWRWLPDSDLTDWHRPDQLYTLQEQLYIGSQVKFVPFGQPTKDFGDFIGLNTKARAHDVISHLLWLAGRGLEVNAQIYRRISDEYVGKDEHKAELERLKGQAVFYEPNQQRFWRAEHVLLGDYHHEFGRYRLSLVGADQYRTLLKFLGASDKPHPFSDYLDLLKQISQNYQKTGHPLDADDQHLINGAYQQLAGQLQSFSPLELSELQGMPIVLDQLNHLRIGREIFFSNRPELLDKFEPGAIATANYIQETARPFLEKIGVRRLGDEVKRELETVTNSLADPENWQSKINSCVRALTRLVKHYETRHNKGWREVGQIYKLKVERLPHLRVRFKIDSPVIIGYVTEQDALLDDVTSRLYLSQKVVNGKAALVIARELAGWLNPTMDAAQLTPLLKEMLSSHNPQTVLDDYEIDHETATGQPLESDASSTPTNSLGITTLDQPTSEIDEPAAPDLPPPTAKLDRPSEPVRAGVNSADSAKPSAKSVAGLISTPPKFRGSTRPDVPRIRTDYERLARRFNLKPADIEQLQQQETAAPLKTDDGEAEANKPSFSVSEVSFTLSFQMRYEGYLPLNSRARALLIGHNQIICTTDDEQEFPLYLDWKEQRAYNQSELTTYFARHDLPAGAIVRLERLHGETYRLYYNRQPHVVKNVRLAEIGEDGRVSYLDIEEMEVNCETNDTIFGVEKRLEDKPALFAEAVGKQSVFEILVNLLADFKAQGRTPISEVELFGLVYMTRMVTHYTVEQELLRRPCFVKTPGGWDFEPERGINIKPVRPSSGRSVSPTTQAMPLGTVTSKPSNPVNTEVRPPEPTQLATKINDSDSSPDYSTSFDRFWPTSPNEWPQAYEEYLQKLAGQLNQQSAQELEWLLPSLQHHTKSFSEQLRRLQPARLETKLTAFSPLDELYNHEQQLRFEPGEPGAVEGLEALFGQTLEADDHTNLQELLSAADLALIGPYIWPLIENRLDYLGKHRHFPPALALLDVYEQHSGQPQADRRQRLQNQSEAQEYYQESQKHSDPKERVDYLALARELDPDMPSARQEFDRCVLAWLSDCRQPVEQKMQAGHLKEAHATLTATATIFNQQYKNWMQDPKAGQAELDKLRIKLLTSYHSAKEPTQPTDHWKAAGAVYCAIYSESERISRCQIYHEILLQLAKTYIVARSCYEASMVFEAIVSFWEMAPQNKGSKPADLFTIREQLANLYEELGRWDLSTPLRRYLSENCRAENRPSRQVQLRQAEEQWGDSAALQAARYRWEQGVGRALADTALKDCLKKTKPIS